MYENFKPTIWSKYIQTEIPKITVFQNDCDFTFEGEAKMGKEVKIIGLAKPTYGDYNPNTDISGPEALQDTSQYLKIDHYKYFHIALDDVDKAQTNGELDLSMEDNVRGFAELHDKFIAEECAKNAKHIETYSSAITTADDAIAVVDAMYEKLWDEGITQKDKTSLYVPPWFYNLIKHKLIDLHTVNDKIITTGLVGYYNNGMVKMSNLIHNDGTYDNIIVKTNKGYAFANGINKVEAYRPEKRFADAIKGLDTWGGKAVRPEQISVAKIKKA